MRNVKFNVSLVSNLSDPEIETIIELSNLAYLDAASPGARVLTGGKLELLPDLFRSMAGSCLIDGECYIAREVTTQAIIGTAFWFPPGKALWATDEIRETTGFNRFFDQLDDATQDWWRHEYGPVMSKFLADHYGPETVLDSWFLNSIAVLPVYQGNGIATSMFEAVVKKATTNEAIGCCTDTEKNAKFYTSLGMSEIGTVYLHQPGGGSDMKTWGFKRYGTRSPA